MSKVIVLDPLAKEGLQLLDAAAASGIRYEVRTGLKGDDLRKALAEFDGAICRSGVKITAAALEGTMWGIGLNQSVEAAAMDLYISYRQYSFDFWTSNATGGKAAKGVALEDMTSVSAGAIIKF